MTPSAPIDHRRPWLLAGICLLVAVVSRLVYVLRPWDPDGAIFIYMGKLAAEGGVFWRDLVDNKLPTVGFLTSGPWRVLGAWWGGYVLLQLLMSLAACLALGRAAVRAAGQHAWWPTVLFALVYLNLNTVVFGGFQLETIHIFFASLGAASAINLLRGDSIREAFADGLALGLCAGCAALAKPTGLSIAAAGGLVLLADIRRPGRLMAGYGGLAVGLAFVFGVVGLYLHRTGILPYLPETLAQIRLYAANSATDLRDSNKLVWAAGLLAFPIVGRLWTMRHAPAEERRSAVPIRRSLSFAALWLCIELVGVVMQKRMYGYHFLVLAPPAALLFGMLPRPWTQRALGLALAPALLLSVLGIGQVVAYSVDYPRQLEASRWLREHADPHDRVWRDMTSRLLIETGLRPGSRYLLTFLFANADHTPELYWAQMKRDFDEHRPRWMVLPTDLPAYLAVYTSTVAELERLPVRRENYLRAWGEIESYVRAHYRPVAVLGRETIWERKPYGHVAHGRQ